MGALSHWFGSTALPLRDPAVPLPPDLFWLNAVSDALIGLAFVAIAAALAFIIWKRHAATFGWVAWIFAGFVLAAGASHWLALSTLWQPLYLVHGLVKAVTAALSVATAILFWPLVGRAIALPTPAHQRDVSRNLSKMLMEKNAALKAMRGSEEYLRLFVDSIADYAIFTLDPEGIVTSWNVGAERAKGYAADEIIGRHFSCFYTLEDRERGEPARSLERALADGRFEVEGERLRKDGTRFLAHVTIRPIRDEAGALVGFAKVTHDVTERRRMAEERRRLREAETEHRFAVARQQFEARFRQVVEAAPTAMMMVDQSGRIELVNAEMEKTFGYARAEMLGQSMEMLIPGRFRVNHSRLLTGYFADSVPRPMNGRRELYGMAKDGREIPLEISLNPIDTEEGKMVLSVIIDISERRQAELERQRYTDELKRSNQDLEQFAYVASHDLKAPLRAIHNLAEWIAEDVGDHASGETLENLSLMGQRVERLEALLSGLLQYSRVGRVKEPPRAVDVGTLVAEIVDYVDPPPGFTVSCHGELPILHTSKPAIEHVMQNLITNAIKHHDRAEGAVTISAEDLGDEVEFAVADDGPGIDPAYHERIFGIFQTLRPRDEVEGSGIGLAIVQKTVRAHGGQIRVDSRPPARGTTFRFTWKKAE